jgi:hypothetical protein
VILLEPFCGPVFAMAKLLALDVSTSYVGVTVLDLNVPIIAQGKHIIMMDHIEFKKLHALTMWTKADHLRDVLVTMSKSFAFQGIEHVFIEDAAKRFSPGMSSADTIGTLLRFNGLASYLIHDIFKLDPIYIPVGAARKLCGLQMMQKKNAGNRGHKEQTYDLMMADDLKHITWPNKKSGQPVDWRYDVVDSYVIAKAGYRIHHGSSLPVKSKKKRKTVP